MSLRSLIKLNIGAGLFGIMLGALLGGPLSDYIGRKSVIIFDAIFFGFCRRGL